MTRVTLNAMARRLGYVVPPGAGDVVALGFRDGERFAFTIDRHGVTGLWPQDDTTGKAVKHQMERQPGEQTDQDQTEEQQQDEQQPTREDEQTG